MRCWIEPYARSFLHPAVTGAVVTAGGQSERSGGTQEGTPATESAPFAGILPALVDIAADAARRVPAVRRTAG